jgi:hypothetical protein
LNIRKRIKAISIEEIIKKGSLNKVKKIKITDEIPIPNGKERFIRKLNWRIFFSLKMIIQEIMPNIREVNIEKNSIILLIELNRY